MKKQIVAMMALACISTSAMQLMSCSKTVDKVTSPPASLAKGKCIVTATISGAYTGEYKSSDALSMVAKGGAVNMASATSSALGGSGGLTEQFVVFLPLDLAVGSYNTKDFSGGNPAQFTYVSSNGATASGWTSGALETNVVFKITKSSSEEVEGTFEGSLAEEEKNTIVRVKGTFAAKF